MVGKMRPNDARIDGATAWVEASTPSLSGVVVLDLTDWERILEDQERRIIGRVTLGKPGANIYARVRVSGEKHNPVYLHRYLLDIPSRLVDHINGNTLDNRRGNLRVCGSDGNSRNKCVGSNSASGLKGVYQEGGRWTAYICPNKTKFTIGTFDTAEAAARAYDLAAVGLYREYARTNYPIEEYGHVAGVAG